MFQVFIAGNVGADAQKQMKDGRNFTTFRVAHNDTVVDAAGVKHSNTQWVDCIMNGHPSVADYLKAGTTVVIIGDATLRTYSSKVDRCIKAGIRVNVRTVELVGGRVDAVPSQLSDQDGVVHFIQKRYFAGKGLGELHDKHSNVYHVDKVGFVTPAATINEPETF